MDVANSLSKRQSTTKQNSITFNIPDDNDDDDDDESTIVGEREDSLDDLLSHSKDSIFQMEQKVPTKYNIHNTPYGFCYMKPHTAVAEVASAALPEGAVLTSVTESRRAEILRRSSDDGKRHILIIGDMVHARSLKKELENYGTGKVSVSVVAVAGAEDVRNVDFFLILLHLEVISGCERVLRSLQRLCKLRSDVLFCCAVVGVSLSSDGQQSHVTELDALHSLLLGERLNYYLWRHEFKGSWPNIVSRIVSEASSCCGDSVAPRSVLTSLLLPAATDSFCLQQYLDLKLHRMDQDQDV